AERRGRDVRGSRRAGPPVRPRAQQRAAERTAPRIRADPADALPARPRPGRPGRQDQDHYCAEAPGGGVMPTRNYPRLGIVPFAQHLLRTGDLDPIYLALNKVQWPEAQKYRWLVAY